MDKQCIVGTAGQGYPKPTSLLVQTASKHASSIHLERGSQTVNLKSIVGVLSLGLKHGDQVILHVNGPDEEAAMARIVQFLTSM